MCNTFKGSSRYQAVEVQRRASELKVEEDAHCMGQDLANQSMLKMPQVMCASPCNGKVLGQVRAYGLNALADSSAHLQHE